MFKKSFIISFLIFSFTVTFAYAGNIGRNVYGVLSETFLGTHFDAGSGDVDSVTFEFWNDQWTDYKNTMKGETITSGAVEGNSYTRLIFLNPKNCGWGAGAIKSTNSGGSKNMGVYFNGKVKFLARVSSENSAALNCNVGMNLNGNIFYVGTLRSLGLEANNQWKELSFELKSSVNSNITETNLGKTQVLIVFMQDSNVSSNLSFDIDNIRWVKNGAPTKLNPSFFDVNLKNVSDNSSVNASTISWTSGYFNTSGKNIALINDTFRKGWVVADKYIEIDMEKVYDVDVSTSYAASVNYSISMCLKNSSSTRNGLYAVTNSGQEVVLPMAWRSIKELISPTTPSQTEIPSFLIKEIIIQKESRYFEGHLKDANFSENYYTWFYFKDSSDIKTDDDKSYVKVWSYKEGLKHGEGAMAPINIAEKKPKIYLAINTTDALGGLKYTGKICVVLAYE